MDIEARAAELRTKHYSVIAEAAEAVGISKPADKKWVEMVDDIAIAEAEKAEEEQADAIFSPENSAADDSDSSSESSSEAENPADPAQQAEQQSKPLIEVDPEQQQNEAERQEQIQQENLEKQKELIETGEQQPASPDAVPVEEAPFFEEGQTGTSPGPQQPVPVEDLTQVLPTSPGPQIPVRTDSPEYKTSEESKSEGVVGVYATDRLKMQGVDVCNHCGAQYQNDLYGSPVCPEGLDEKVCPRLGGGTDTGSGSEHVFDSDTFKGLVNAVQAGLSATTSEEKHSALLETARYLGVGDASN